MFNKFMFFGRYVPRVRFEVEGLYPLRSKRLNGQGYKAEEDDSIFHTDTILIDD